MECQSMLQVPIFVGRDHGGLRTTVRTQALLPDFVVPEKHTGRDRFPTGAAHAAHGREISLISLLKPGH